MKATCRPAVYATPVGTRLRVNVVRFFSTYAQYDTDSDLVDQLRLRWTFLPVPTSSSFNQRAIAVDGADRLNCSSSCSTPGGCSFKRPTPNFQLPRFLGVGRRMEFDLSINW